MYECPGRPTPSINYGNRLQCADILRAMIPHHAESLAELDILNLNFEETSLIPSFRGSCQPCPHSSICAVLRVSLRIFWMLFQ